MFGGPIEDALTLDLAGVSHLETRLFNLKQVKAGKAARKPDLNLNSPVDAFVERVLAAANNKTEVVKLNEHIARFDTTSTDSKAYYGIGESDLLFSTTNSMEINPCNLVLDFAADI